MARKLLSLEQHTALKLEEIKNGSYLPDPDISKPQSSIVSCKCHYPTQDMPDTKAENNFTYRKIRCGSCGTVQWRIA